MKKRRRHPLLIMGITGISAICMFAGCGKKESVVASSENNQEPVLPENQELTIDYTSVEGLEVSPGSYVAVVVKGLGENTYWEIIQKGVEAAVADINTAMGFEGEEQLRLTFEGPAEESNEEEQINTLDTVLAENPTALCLAAIDMESCQAQLETARDNEIPVLILDAGIESDLVTAVCQTDNEAAGEAAGKELFEKLGGSGKVALIGHQPETETCKLRRKGFKKALEQYPEIELVYEIEEKADCTIEEQLAEMKEQYPDLDGVFATNERNSDAVLKLYSEEELIPVIVGFDNGEEQIQAIKNGLEYGCICQNPYSMGYAVVMASLRAANGEEVDSIIDTGFQWIDQTNIDDPENQIYLYQ